MSKKIAISHTAPTDLQKKYEQKCRKDYSLNVITRIVGKTFWIYAPTNKPLFDFAAESPSPPDPLKKVAKYDLLYIDGSYKDKIFHFEYDIIPKTKSSLQNEGIRNEGTDYFNKLYNNLFTAVTETLLDPHTPISFVVMCITDIKKGIEARYTFYLEDYRMASVEGIPYDEFSKRVLQESKGSTNYIGDEIGQHLEYTDILMPDFLTKQMINRIRFKFTQSDFPPQESYEEAILGVIADTNHYYRFKDFKEVRTNDIRARKKMILTPKQLAFFGEDKMKDNGANSKGKLIHIIFEDGKTTFKDQ
ncbi:MAG: hypothetical protein HQL12_03820 [Candidatus Omnitrophica bacterium]|nr:hypothetical protein [Candidatus Omnitrophota bacterium]